MSREEFDTTSTETLICPYCGAEQEDAREQEDWGTPETWECCDCTKDFVYTTETVLKFTSENLGEYLEDKIRQEKYHLSVLEKNLKELQSGDEIENKIKLLNQLISIDKSKKRLAAYEEKLDLFAKSCFEDIEND